MNELPGLSKYLFVSNAVSMDGKGHHLIFFIPLFLEKSDRSEIFLSHNLTPKKFGLNPINLLKLTVCFSKLEQQMFQTTLRQAGKLYQHLFYATQTQCITNRWSMIHTATTWNTSLEKDLMFLLGIIEDTENQMASLVHKILNLISISFLTISKTV